MMILVALYLIHCRIFNLSEIKLVPISDIIFLESLFSANTGMQNTDRYFADWLTVHLNVGIFT